MSCNKFILSVIFSIFTMLVLVHEPTVALGNSNDAAAQAAYKKAKAFFDNEQYAEAAKKFRDAYELKPSWKILFNIGQCEAAAKNHGLALEAFEMFLSEGGDDIFGDRREQVISEVDRLRHMVGYIKVTAPKGTMIRINDTERGVAPVFMSIPVSAGRMHTLSGTLKGAELESREFRVVGAQTISIELEAPESAPPVAAETPAEEQEGPIQEDGVSADDATDATAEKAVDADDAPGAPPAKKKSKLKLIGWIVTGVGGGTLAAGAVLGGISLKKNGDLKDECGNTPCPEKKDEVESNIKMANVSTALYIGGGVVAATGVVLLILGIKKEKLSASAPTIFPAIANDTFGAGMEWRF